MMTTAMISIITAIISTIASMGIMHLPFRKVVQVIIFNDCIHRSSALGAKLNLKCVYGVASWTSNLFHDSSLPFTIGT